MERLTRRIRNGSADCTYCTEEYYDNGACKDSCSLRKRQMERLAVYEDILCPDDAPEITLERLVELCKAEREGRLEIPKYKIGDTVYVIANCAGINRKLDGTWSSADGSPGTATGYYCPFDENWDECPLAAGRDECDQNGYAVFVDYIDGITISYDENTNEDGNEPHIYYSLHNVLNYCDNEIYSTREAAEAALAKKG